MNRKTRKQILDNLEPSIRRCLPAAGPGTIERLGELAAQREELLATRESVSEQTGILSRKIGQAKTAGDPADDLIASMQIHGRELKVVNTRISEVETSILQYFDSTGSDIQQGTGRATEQPRTNHRYAAEPDGPVTISLLAGETGDWNNYVERHPYGSIYHRAEWRDLISTTFGHTCYYCMARDKASRVVGVLPLVRLKSLLFGDFLVSMPYFNYGGALGNSPDTEQSLMEFAADQAKQLGVSHAEFRDNVRRDGYPVRDEKVNMVLALPEDESSLWDSFPSKLRSQVRRSQQENPVMHTGGRELLDDFYSVFARNMRDLGTPVYDRRFFQNILHSFPAESHILVVTIGGKPVAAGFLIGHGTKMEIPWASTIKDVNHLSINMFLYWEALKYSIGKGFRQFDFGRSTTGAGTYRFKQQWGAKPVRLYWHYWLRDGGELPSLNPSNPKYALFIRLWKRLPVAVTKLLGPLIVRNLP